MAVAGWLQAHLDRVAAAEGDKVAHFEQLVANEVEHGLGLGNMAALEADLAAAAAEIEAVVGRRFGSEPEPAASGEAAAEHVEQ